VSSERLKAKEIVEAIVENLREGLEDLMTEVVAPSLYQVYLHEDDYDRLKTLMAKIEKEAAKTLDLELARLEREEVPTVKRLIGQVRKKPELAHPPRKYVSAAGGWQIRFQPDPNGRLAPGEIEVVSEFAPEVSPDYSAGSKTHRILTSRKLGQGTMTTRRETVGDDNALARISYRDEKGPHTFHMAAEEIVIGRLADGVWADLRLETFPDVSREHARIKRTPEGVFRIKDLSKLGTWIDGNALPKNEWSPMPDRCRIGLAGVIDLEFEKAARP
jgi:hypothetical protein